jgi:hypothetical protein
MMRAIGRSDARCSIPAGRFTPAAGNWQEQSRPGIPEMPLMSLPGRVFR